jgi:hypothetical protein
MASIQQFCSVRPAQAQMRKSPETGGKDARQGIQAFRNLFCGKIGYQSKNSLF